MRGIKRGRILSARFGPRQERILIKILNSLLVYFDRSTKARIQIIIQVNLIGGEAPDVGFA